MRPPLDRTRVRPARTRAISTFELVAVFAAGAGLGVLGLARLLPKLAERIPGTPDALLVVSLLRWGVGSLGSWDAFWSPPFFFPTAGVRTYADHFFGPLLAFGPLARLGGDALGYNLVLLLSFPLAALTVHVLLRSLGASRWSSTAMALAWTVAPYRWDQIGRLQLLWTPGLPLALVAFDRLLARPTAARAGLFLAGYALALSGGSYFGYWLHLPLATIAILRLRRTRRRLFAGRSRWSLAAAALGAAALAALSFGPYLAASNAGRLIRAEREVRALSAHVTSWLAPSARNVYSGAWPAEWLASERALFPGFLLAAAALLGAAACFADRRRRRPRALEAALYLSAAVLAALTFAPVWLAFAGWVPGMSAMRATTRTYPYVLLAFSALGTHGLALVARGLGRHPWRVLAPIVVALLAVEAWPLRFGPGELPRVDSVERHRGYVGALLALADVRAVAVLPLTGDHRESRRLQPATVYGRPLVNGYSGFTAPSYELALERCGVLRQPVTRDCLDYLAGLGVSHVVVENWPERLAEPLAPAAVARARAVFRDRWSTVFELDSPFGVRTGASRR